MNRERTWTERPSAGLPERAARDLLGDLDERARRTGYDPPPLSCSIGSEVAGPILAGHVVQGFIEPIAAALGGRHTRERAAMLAAHVIGISSIRVAARRQKGNALKRKKLEELSTAALSACVAPGS